MATKNSLTPISLCIAVTACHRFDTLTVIDNPYGPGVIIDNIYAGDDRVICVVKDVASECSLNNANIIVKNTKSYANVTVGWGVKNDVNVRVAHGRLTHADTSALDGAIKISVTVP